MLYSKIIKLLICLGFLMLLDYLLTYLGMHHLQVINEGNPFMRLFMTLPLSIGLPLRILYILIPITLLFIAFHLTSNKQKLIHILYGLIGFQLIPFGLHMFWLMYLIGI